MPEFGPAALILLSFIGAISALVGVYGASALARGARVAARRTPQHG